jgi:hypothetical protein
MSTKLITELKKRFGTPQAVLAALGLDADLLTHNKVPVLEALRRSSPDLLALRRMLALDAASGGGPDALKKMRFEIEQLLDQLDIDDEKFGRILELLEKHAPTADQSHSQANAANERPLTGKDDVEEAERVGQFRNLLKDRGLSDEDVDSAVDLALGILPKNALNGGMGGRLSGAMDSVTRHRISAIKRETFGDRDRRRPAPVLGMDRRTVDKLHEKFPGIALIGRA